MSVAAALNILVTSPNEQFAADLKKHQITASQFGNHLTKVFGQGATRAQGDITKMMSSIDAAFKEGLVSLDRYESGMQMLNGAFKFVEAGGDGFNAMVAEGKTLNDQYASSLDKMAAKLAKLNALNQSGALKPHVFQQAHDDITGVSDQRRQKSDQDAQRQLARQQHFVDKFEKAAIASDRRVEASRQAGYARLERLARDNDVRANEMRAKEVRDRAAVWSTLERKGREASAQAIAIQEKEAKNREAIWARLEAKGRAADEIANARKAATARSQSIQQAALLNIAEEANALNIKHRTPLEQLRASELRLNAARAQGLLTQRAFNREMREANALYRSQATLAGRLGFTLSGFKSAASIFNPWFLAAAGVGKFVHILGEFEFAMDRVQVLTGASTKQMALLTDQASELGATTVFSAKDAADGMAALAKASFKTQEIIEAMPATLDLAAIGQLEVGDAAGITARIMAGMKIPATDLQDVIDAIAVASTNSVNTVEDLGEAMKFVGPAAAQAGKSIDEVMMVLMALGDAGMSGELGGTAARNIFFRMANQTTKAKDELERLGVSFHDVNGEFLHTIEIVKQFEDAWSGMTGAEKLESANRIFQTRSATGFNALVGAGSEKLTQFQGLLAERQGLADKMAEAQNANLFGDFERLGSALSKFATDAEELGIVFRVIVQGATLLVNAFQTTASLAVMAWKFAIGTLTEFVGNLMAMLPSGWGSETGEALAKWGKEVASDGAATSLDAMIKNAEQLRQQSAMMMATATGNDPRVEEIQREIDALDDQIAQHRDNVAKAATEDAEKAQEELQKELDILTDGKDVVERRLLLEAGASAEVVARIAHLQKEIDLQKRLHDLFDKVLDAKHEFQMIGMTEGQRVVKQSGLAGSQADLAAKEIDFWKKQTDQAKTLLEIEEERKKMAFERRMIEKQGGKELDKWQKLEAEAKARGADAKHILAIRAAGTKARAEQDKIDQAVEGRKNRQKMVEDLRKAGEQVNEKFNPLENFKKEIEELRILKGAGLIDQATFTKARQDLLNNTLKSAGPKNIENAAAIEAGSKEAYSATVRKSANPEFDELKKQTTLAEKLLVSSGQIKRGIDAFNKADKEFALPPP